MTGRDKPSSKATKEGVAEAASGWAWQHPVTIVDAIEDGTEKAVRAWLDANSQLVADAIAKRHGHGCPHRDTDPEDQ